MLVGVDGSIVALAALLGALMGSFANVVVYRLPRGMSIVRPRSRCPACQRTLDPLDLVPVLSFVVLRGRCRTCRARISPRYPLVEGLFAAGFALMALMLPPVAFPWGAALLAVVATLLACAALIDGETFTLPDVLTLGALALTWLGAALLPAGTGLPSLQASIQGAAYAAGGLVLVNRLGALVLRRGRDTRERLHPVSFDTVGIATLAGTIAGVNAAWLAGGAQIVASALTRRSVRVPEPLLYGAWAMALTAMTLRGAAQPALEGGVLGAGSFALLGGIWWAIADRIAPRPNLDVDEPTALGFGDVKLAGALGALLGGEGFAVAVTVAVFTGALVGGIMRARGGGRVVPFGPFLVLGGAVAALWGDALANGYAALLGF